MNSQNKRRNNSQTKNVYQERQFNVYDVMSSCKELGFSPKLNLVLHFAWSQRSPSFIKIYSWLLLGILPTDNYTIWHSIFTNKPWWRETLRHPRVKIEKSLKKVKSNMSNVETTTFYVRDDFQCYINEINSWNIVSNRFGQKPPHFDGQNFLSLTWTEKMSCKHCMPLNCLYRGDVKKT